MDRFPIPLKKYFNLDHEYFTQAIILGDTEVNEVLKKVGTDFPKKVAEVIAKTYQNNISGQFDFESN